MQRHDLDAFSLTFGLLFIAVATVGLVDRTVLALADLRWLFPALLVVIGLLLVVGPSVRSRRAEADAAASDDNAASR